LCGRPTFGDKAICNIYDYNTVLSSLRLTNTDDYTKWKLSTDSCIFQCRYIYCILGGETAREMKHRLKKLKRKIEIMSREIETVTEEIEHLLRIRDNGLKFSVYRDFVDRKRAEKWKTFKEKYRKLCHAPPHCHRFVQQPAPIIIIFIIICYSNPNRLRHFKIYLTRWWTILYSFTSSSLTVCKYNTLNVLAHVIVISQYTYI